MAGPYSPFSWYQNGLNGKAAFRVPCPQSRSSNFVEAVLEHSAAARRRHSPHVSCLLVKQAMVPYRPRHGWNPPDGVVRAAQPCISFSLLPGAAWSCLRPQEAKQGSIPAEAVMDCMAWISRRVFAFSWQFNLDPDARSTQRVPRNHCPAKGHLPDLHRPVVGSYPSVIARVGDVPESRLAAASDVTSSSPDFRSAMSFSSFLVTVLK